jgi:dUTP pyrophosphatase
MEHTTTHGISLLTETAIIPTKGSVDSAGFDLYADAYKIINPGKRCLVSTGISIEFARGYYGQIFGRSGLAFKNGIMLMAGVIDNDYRGEIKALLFNSGEEVFTVNVGDRIAQLVILPYCKFPLTVAGLSQTARGTSGFGSTGK